MPEGPFGFPRLTSVGPFVEDDIDNPEEKLEEITSRTHSYRNYSPEEFIKLKGEVSGGELRGAMNAIEGGRFTPMLKKVHRFFIQLDGDEMHTFAERNPGLIEWVDAWAVAEDQIKPSTLLENN